MIVTQLTKTLLRSYRLRKKLFPNLVAHVPVTRTIQILRQQAEEALRDHTSQLPR